MTWRQIRKLDLAVPHHAYLQVLRSENQCVDRNQERRVLGGNAQMHFCIRATKQSISWVRKINFCQQCAGGSVNGFGRSHDFSWKLLPREFSEDDVRRALTGLNTS